MKKSMQQTAPKPKRTQRTSAAAAPTHTRLADHRRPLPADVIERCADTGSSHGFRTQ